MVTDLPPQTQNIPPKSVYAVIEQYVPNHSVEHASNQEPISKQTLPNPKHFGGYLTTSGTAQVSQASGVAQNITFGWIPWEGKIPSLLVQFDYESHTLEIKPELTSKMYE